VERSFAQGVAEGFQNLGSLQGSSPEPDESPGADSPELSLIEPDEMEESVAAENLILRANASYFPELFAMSQRLALINGVKKLKDHQIPGGPHHLVSAYRRALALLEVDARVKVILYALFDRFLLKQIKPTYDEYNRLLIEAGVLPTLKGVPLRPEQAQSGPPPAEPQPEPEAQPQSAYPPQSGYRPHSAPPSQPYSAPASQAYAPPSGQPYSAYPPYSAQSAMPPDSGLSPESVEDAFDRGSEPPDSQTLGGEIFDSILDIMATRRPAAARGGRGRRAPPPSPEESRLQSRELISAISSIQANRSPAAVSTAVTEATRFPTLEVDAEFVSRVRNAMIAEREQVLKSVDRDKLAPVDSDLIDLIGMLFEYMLNDPVLPNVAKALLSHLHTPYLKVALIDRRLLVDSRHPARRLLDQMVEAGSLWVEEGNAARGLFPAMQQTVDRVLQEFTDDVTLFDELCSFFEEKMREQQRRSDTMEQRTQEAARGREKLALAKQRAAQEIQRLVGRFPTPKPVADFLSKTWLDHLVFILLRDEEQERGNTWKHAVAIAEELMSLFDPQCSPERRRARMAALPKLRDSIALTAQRVGGLNSVSVAALLALLDSPQNWQSHTMERPEIPVPQHAGLAAPGAAGGAGAPILASAAAPDQGLTGPEREMVERLRRMRFGTWFEIVGAAGAPARRIKLSWMSPLTSTCMFVDRSGMQAEIKTLRDLAQEILAGRAKVIPRPKHPFIDRALVSIRKMLQSDEERPAPAGAAGRAPGPAPLSGPT
jgi:hypothetical protein